MAGLLIKNVPTTLHRRLKEIAARHHRSMTREALALLEVAVDQAQRESKEFPAPFKGPHPLTDKFLNQAKREGRA